MKMRNILILIGIAVFLTGCSVQFAGTQSGKAGVYVSFDDGQNWTQRVSSTDAEGKSGTIGGFNINDIVIDPSDSNTWYLTSPGRGLWVSYNSGQVWQKLYGGSNTVTEIKVHPKDSKTLFVILGRQLLTSKDDGKNWEVSYSDPVPTNSLSTVVIDSYNPQRILLGTSTGSILLSEDGGLTWKATYVPEGTSTPMSVISVSSQDTRVVFAANAGELFKSTDGGRSWENYSRSLREFNDLAANIKTIIINPKNNKNILLHTNYALLRSTDGGENFEQIQLLTKAKSVRLRAAAVDPNNQSKIYYSVIGTLYKTTDGGKTWLTTPLPQQYLPTALALVKQEKDDMIVLGFTVPSN